MSLIVAARFDTFDAAEAAAARFFAQGWEQDALNIFFVNPPGAHARYPVGGDRAADPDARGAEGGAWGGAAAFGAVGAVVGAGLLMAFGQAGWIVVAAAAVGAYLGALGGALSVAGKAKRAFAKSSQTSDSPPVRPSGVLLAVHVEPGQQTDVADMLRACGGKDVERANGRWREGRWVDFDPIEPPSPVRPSDAPADAGAPTR